MGYRCENCGAYHESDNSPCFECAGESLVPEEEYSEDAQDSENGTKAPKWRCEDCGKVHPRNSPPCSRCGSMQLTNDPDAEIDQGVPTNSSGESRGGLWYASRAAAFVAVVLVLLAGMSVVSGDPVGTNLLNSKPEPIEVAGYDDTYEGVNLTAVEREIAAGINSRRSGATLAWSSSLHEAAEYHNHRAVKNNYRGWGRETSAVGEDIRSFGASCERFDGATNNYDTIGELAYVETGTEAEVADAIVGDLWQYEDTRSRLEKSYSRIGVDIFVTEEKETLLVVYVC